MWLGNHRVMAACKSEGTTAIEEEGKIFYEKKIGKKKKKKKKKKYMKKD